MFDPINLAGCHRGIQLNWYFRLQLAAHGIGLGRTQSLARTGTLFARVGLTLRGRQHLGQQLIGQFWIAEIRVKQLPKHHQITVLTHQHSL